MSNNDNAKIDDGGSAFPADIQIMRLEAAINQARRFITAAEYAARQLRTGKEDACRSYAHAEAKRQSMTLTRKLAMVRRSAYAGGDRP